MKGEYQHNIDAKGRLFFPTKLKESLGDSFIVTKGLDGCLFVYSMGDWDKLEEKISALPMSKSRDLQRFFFSSACDCTPDGQGRILLPPVLREYAGIEKEVTVVGVSNRAEIWDSAKWRAYTGGVSAVSIAQAMEELGF